jgi:hypothetical protein
MSYTTDNTSNIRVSNLDDVLKDFIKSYDLINKITLDYLMNIITWDYQDIIKNIISLFLIIKTFNPPTQNPTHTKTYYNGLKDNIKNLIDSFNYGLCLLYLLTTK